MNEPLSKNHPLVKVHGLFYFHIFGLGLASGNEK